MVSSQPWRRNESSSRRACPSRQHCQVADELRRHGPEAKAGPTPLACGSLNLYRLSQTGPPPRTEPSAPTSAQQGPDWPSHHLPHWEGAVQSPLTPHTAAYWSGTPPPTKMAPDTQSAAVGSTRRHRRRHTHSPPHRCTQIAGSGVAVCSVSPGSK